MADAWLERSDGWVFEDLTCRDSTPRRARGR